MIMMCCLPFLHSEIQTAAPVQKLSVFVQDFPKFSPSPDQSFMRDFDGFFARNRITIRHQEPFLNKRLQQLMGGLIEFSKSDT